MSRSSSTGLRAAVAAMSVGAVALLAGAQPAEAQGYKWPRYFNVITPVVGTANHSLAVAWTTEFSAKTGVRVRVLPTSTGYARTEWLNTNQGRLSVYQPSDFFDQMDATEGYAKRTAGPSDTRVAYINLVTPWGYMVRGDSRIKTVDDVTPGTRVVFYTGSTFISNGIRALLALAGVKESEVDKVEVGGYVANTKVVTEGRGEVTFTSPISGTSYEAEAAPQGIRWLEISPDHANFAAYRALQGGYILSKTVSGVKSAIGKMMDHAYQSYHVRGDEDPEFVYQVVKWLDENYDLYKGKFTHAKMMSMASLLAYLDAGALEPLHEGTIRYLKEKGKWRSAYQTRQDQLVALMNKRVEVFQAAMDAAHDAKVLTDSPNEKWQAFLADFKKKNGVTKTFAQEVEALSMN